MFTSKALLTTQDLKSLESLLDFASDEERQSLETALAVIDTPEGTATRSPAHLGQHVYGPTQYNIFDHTRLIDDELIRLTRRDIRRLMVFTPPQHGKSMLCSELFPAWYLGHNPTHRIIHVSYGHRLASRFARKSRDILEQHGDLWGVRVRSDVRSVYEYELEGTGGSFVSAGIGSGIAGRRADLLIVDDPVKDDRAAVSEVARDHAWDWWISVARTRLREDGLVLIIQTRWHEDDLSGRALRDQQSENWNVVELRALAEGDDPLGREPGESLCPQMYSQEYLERVRDSMLSYWWSSLYQQRPTQYGGVLWARHLFEGEDIRFSTWPGNLRIKVMSLDPACGKGGDYSAYCLAGATPDGVLWIDADLDNIRGPRDTVLRGGELYRDFRPDLFGCESNASQELYRPLFSELVGHDAVPVAIENKVKKELRIGRLDEWISRRLVRYRRTQGTERLIAQLREFPQGSHDDGPDAFEMAVRLLCEAAGIHTERFAGRLSA